MSSSQQLAAILRDTLKRVEVSADVSPDDSALTELKRVILLKLASLEAGDAPEPTLPPSLALADLPSKPPFDASLSEPSKPQAPSSAPAHFPDATVNA